VECAGRADDQVKIRGFRIELGEIDTYLSQHPLVRENVTLVRRDKDEEPTLVSYIVPQQSSELSDLLSDEDQDNDLEVSSDELVRGLRRYRKLIREIREHLKSKLPAYAVPTGHPQYRSHILTRSFRTSYEDAVESKWKSGQTSASLPRHSSVDSCVASITE
jgi:acyl-CoA synthetase (AMP-forming)/AMP-acid ligase II